MSIRIRIPTQPTRPPRCGGSHSATRKCLKPLLLAGYDVDENGDPTSDPTWWCPAHHDRPDPNGLAPPPEGVSAAIAQCSSGTPITNLTSRNYRAVIL
jgi:hypothetical protein